MLRALFVAVTACLLFGCGDGNPASPISPTGTVVSSASGTPGLGPKIVPPILEPVPDHSCSCLDVPGPPLPTMADLQALVGSATALHFRRWTNPSDAAFDLDITVTNPSVVRAIFQETLSQPAVPDGLNCDFDPESIYPIRLDVTVMNADAKGSAFVELDPFGCHNIVVEGQYWLEESLQYWKDLAKALGVEEPSIYPWPWYLPNASTSTPPLPLFK